MRPAAHRPQSDESLIVNAKGFSKGQSETSGNVIRRSDLDGSNLETYITNVRNVTGIAIAIAPPSPSPLGNCDGLGGIDLLDLPCFVNALLGTDTNPPGGISRSDINEDGHTDGIDVQLFINALMP